MKTVERSLRAERQELYDKLKILKEEIAHITEKIQKVCVHEWKWMPVAGEGKYCPRCDARDYSDD